ncbi:MAG: hypothetical protein K6G62_06945 [Eubacterium sp.]|nr:hypothetical protein [Eubacterium sp.]
MGKRKKLVIGAFVLAFLLILAMVAYVLYRKWAPSNEQADINKLFNLTDGQVAILVDDELLTDEKDESIVALNVDGFTYVPAGIASTYFDKRIFVDDKEGILSYATKDGLIQAESDETGYKLGKENKQSEDPILKELEDGFYVSLNFIKEHTANDIKEYSTPARLVVMTDRDATYTFATLSEDTRVRTGPGKKYAYYTEALEGAQLIVETDVKEENAYTCVTTEDGVTGYVPSERIAAKKEASWEFEGEPETFEQEKFGKTICLGWHQVTSETSSKLMYSGISSANSMNVICPTVFSLKDSQGNFTCIADTSYVNQAHALGKKVWGLVDDFAKGIKLSSALGQTSNRTKLINGLVGKAIQYDLDGINVDFENVTKDNAAAYLQFLRELVLKAHVNDLLVSVDNYPPMSYNAFYDLEEQGRIVDYVVLMAYDEHYAGSEESGSVSSISYVKNGLEGMLKQVPKGRVVTALPFYTRLWKESKKKGGQPSSTAYGMSAAETILKSNDVSAKWDDETQQFYAEYKAGGFKYKIWLEEETSIEKKLELVKEKDIAGVAFWKLGFERPATWTVISKYVGK